MSYITAGSFDGKYLHAVDFGQIHKMAVFSLKNQTSRCEKCEKIHFQL